MISFPVEIQLLILPLLTPSSLISLSQTSQYFRQLIDPQKKHFVNQLLEQECLPKYGGEVTINPQAKLIIPPGTVSYACTHCLKIIPHTHFDNHALLRLRFRKPPPEARATQNICGWTSGNAKTQGLMRQAGLRNDTLRSWVKQNSSSGIPESKLVELYKIGTSRNRRMCNECKFMTGFFSRNIGVKYEWRVKHRNTSVGTAMVPVVKGRQRRCHDSTERYFYGLFPVASDTEYPWRYKNYREENCDWWTLWSIRCPGCAIWQERAAFRKGNGYGVKATPADSDEWRQVGWDGPHFEDWRCNRCLVTSAGKEELGNQLLAFWKRLAGFEISMFKNLLPAGWYDVEAIEFATERKYSWRQIVKEDSIFSQSFTEIPTAKKIADMDIEKRRHYYRIFKRWFDNLEDPEAILGGLLNNKHGFRRWSTDYEILEKRIKDLEICTKILEADPDKLVRYALDGYAPLV